MHPREIHISDYTYNLPEEKIAHYPLPERDASKLLVYQNGTIAESVYKNIADFLPENSLLVFNNTKVIHARLFFENANGGKVEVFCLEPLEANTEMASVMSRMKTIRWKCLVGRASKWKEKVLRKSVENFELTAEIVDRTNDTFVVEFNWQPEHLTFAEILDKAGMMPIPPYLHRNSNEVDLTRYQTVYAKHEGSVAAPTAGLHFTEAVFESLKKKDIETAEVTLHVGAGTFKPVKSETMADHEMHAELIDVNREALEKLIAAKETKKPVVSVGTTSMRTLESLYWMGIKAANHPTASLPDLEIKQWDVYELLANDNALIALLNWMKQNSLERIICKTQIIIAPPYQPKVVNALVTNFHQPNSTLLLLVAAVVGNDWKKIYDYALTHNFRFLSYGDGSLLFVNQ
jgi:S-adenosylmethionine:tRNA ribosyltransferase-isomerase